MTAGCTRAMSTVPVVDIRRLTDDGVDEAIARFVLMPDGSATIVELIPGGRSTVEALLQAGIPGPDGNMLFPQAGLAYMQRLPYLLHATYLWATKLYEMDVGDALAGATWDSST
jgi:hypothetical protein